MLPARLLTLVRDWFSVRRSRRALCAFSDRDLADIDLVRPEHTLCARQDRRIG